jgi:hypothetical protein
METNVTYTIKLQDKDDTYILDTDGTFEDAYELARNYHHYATLISFFNFEGENIVTITREQLMDRNLTINYKD